MADKFLKIAVMLSAVDNMSSVLNRALDGASDRAKAFEKTSKLLGEGAGLIAAGSAGLSFMGRMTDAFGKMQEAANSTKSTMMTDGGVLDGKMFERITRMSEKLSDTYTGTTGDYLDMVRVLKSNAIDPKDILGGIGEATAKLSVFLNAAPDQTAEFAASMRRDMGVAAKDMGGVMDLVARLNGVGVGKTGSETIADMGQVFSKAGLGMQNLGMGGMKDAKDMGALAAIFVQRKISAESVGTNMRRIFDGLLNSKRLGKANNLAAAYGIQFDLFDKAGKFKGIPNFVAQMGKLSNLKPEVIGKILEPFSGKQGLSTDFLQNIGQVGVKEFNEMNQKLAHQATLDQKVKTMMDGLNMQSKVMKSTWTNTAAAFGASVAGPLTALYRILNSIGSTLRNLLENNPRLARFAGAFVTLASAGLMVMGVVKVLQAITFVMRLLNITMLANPFILFATVAIVAVALIYTYWDKITAFFSGLWGKVKAIFSKFWEWAKFLFLNFTPEGLIIKYWDKFPGWFATLWTNVKNVFLGFLKWFYVDLPLSFLKAGVNIMEALWKGIKAGAGKVWDAIKGVAKTIRDFFPFSPAKEGPLRDLHKVRIVETIASAMKPGPAITAARNVAGGMAAAFTNRGTAAGGGITLNYNPNVYITGGNRDEFMDMLRKHKADIMRMLASAQNRNAAISF